MPITIGARQESDFNDPIGMLGDCHRRIERFLAVLRKLASERNGGPLTEEDRAALTTSLRYFREAAPKHTADEEDSLFPRLRNVGGPAVESLFEQIDGLERDHETAVKAHEEVDRLGQLWLSGDGLSSEDTSQLVAILDQLAALYERHIAIEDAEVFPAAARLLSPADRRSVGAEMAVRRGVRPA
jgi:hemerythrin-like domain-containing protein